MKILIALAFLAVTSLTLNLGHVNTHEGIGDVRVGGFTRETLVANQNSLNPEHAKMNQFVRNNVPEVKGLKLLTYKDQVVAGMNYCFTYDSETQPGLKKIEICVWSKPWENNFLQVRRPDGSIIKVGGFDAIPANTVSTTLKRF